MAGTILVGWQNRCLVLCHKECDIIVPAAGLAGLKTALQQQTSWEHGAVGLTWTHRTAILVERRATAQPVVHRIHLSRRDLVLLEALLDQHTRG